MPTKKPTNSDDVENIDYEPQDFTNPQEVTGDENE